MRTQSRLWSLSSCLLVDLRQGSALSGLPFPSLDPDLVAVFPSPNWGPVRWKMNMGKIVGIVNALVSWGAGWLLSETPSDVRIHTESARGAEAQLGLLGEERGTLAMESGLEIRLGTRAATEPGGEQLLRVRHVTHSFMLQIPGFLLCAWPHGKVGTWKAAQGTGAVRRAWRRFWAQEGHLSKSRLICV